jgi:phage shock protein C
MEQAKRLYRSKRDSKIAGVCAGLAEFFNIDPTLVRIFFALLAVAGGPGVLLYIVLWVLVPEEPFGDVVYRKRKHDEV